MSFPIQKYGKNLFLQKKIYVYFIFFIVIFFTYIIFSTQIKSYNKLKADNFNVLVSSNEFKNLGNYFLSSLRSPYKEYKYIIQNNDSIEKIFNNYKIISSEVNYITNELKKKNYLISIPIEKLVLLLKKIMKTVII